MKLSSKKMGSARGSVLAAALLIPLCLIAMALLAEQPTTSFLSHQPSELAPLASLVEPPPSDFPAWIMLYPSNTSNKIVDSCTDGTYIYTAGTIGPPGSERVVVTKWMANGSIAWSKTWGTGNLYATAESILVLGARVYVCGALKQNIVYPQYALLLVYSKSDGALSYTSMWDGGGGDNVATKLSTDGGQVYAACSSGRRGGYLAWNLTGSLMDSHLLLNGYRPLGTCVSGGFFHAIFTDGTGIALCRAFGGSATISGEDLLPAVDVIGGDMWTDGSQVHVMVTTRDKSFLIEVDDVMVDTIFADYDWILGESIEWNGTSLVVSGNITGTSHALGVMKVASNGSVCWIRDHWGAGTWAATASTTIDGTCFTAGYYTDVSGSFGWLMKWYRNPLPRARFVANVSTAIAGSPVALRFTGFEGDWPGIVKWNCSSAGLHGQSSAYFGPAAHQIWTFSTPGIHEISIKITDGSGDVSTYASNITVVPDLVPAPAIIADSIWIQVGDRLEFAASGSWGNGRGTLTWHSDIVDGRGEDDSLSTPISSPGSHVIQLVYVDVDGDVGTSSITVHAGYWMELQYLGVIAAIVLAVAIVVKVVRVRYKAHVAKIREMQARVRAALKRGEEAQRLLDNISSIICKEKERNRSVMSIAIVRKMWNGATNYPDEDIADLLDMLADEGVLIEAAPNASGKRYKIAGASSIHAPVIAVEIPRLSPAKAAARPISGKSNGGSVAREEPKKKQVPAASSPSRPKPSYPARPAETPGDVSRTTLKVYIERKRKEGARELHYIQIKNDLNVISQKKSGKLYRVLQALVDNEILVRKGSNYIIVG